MGGIYDISEFRQIGIFLPEGVDGVTTQGIQLLPQHQRRLPRRGRTLGAQLLLCPFFKIAGTRYSNPTLCMIRRICAGSGSIIMGATVALAVCAGPRAA